MKEYLPHFTPAGGSWWYTFPVELDQFRYHFPFFRTRPSGLASAAPYFIPFRAEAGKLILSPGEECGTIPFLYSGSIRVYQTHETGRELTLYTIEPGESCILTSSCILQTQKFPAYAGVLKQAEGVALPAGVLKSLTRTSEDWQTFVFQLYGQRIFSLLELVSAVSFQKLDERLWKYLLQRQGYGKIQGTHEEIAMELGSSREVISRLLKEWEIQGKLVLRRGEIKLCDGGHGTDR